METSRTSPRDVVRSSAQRLAVAVACAVTAACLVPVEVGSDGVVARDAGPGGLDAGGDGGDGGDGAADAGPWNGPPRLFCCQYAIPTWTVVRADGGNAMDAGGVCGDEFWNGPPLICNRRADGGLEMTAKVFCVSSNCWWNNCGDISCGDGTTCVGENWCR